MKFTVKFDCDNAAFDGAERAHEIARILRDIAKRVEAGSTDGKVRDINGNVVGRYDLSNGGSK